MRIFHFGGHASGSMLLFEDAGGKPAAAHAGGLASYLGQQRGLVLVFLNGCCTEAQVRRLREAGVKAVVATTASILDDVAAEFAKAFYTELATRSLRRAFDAAVAEVQLRRGDDPRAVTRDVDWHEAEQRAAPRAWPWVIDCDPHYEGWTLDDGASDAGDLARTPLPGVARPAAASLRSTVPTTVGQPRFTGRDAELRAIDAALAADRIVVICGAPGLGKSRLALEYAHARAGTYPGGMFFVPFPFRREPPSELAKLLRGTDRPAYPDESVEDQCRRALESIGNAGRALLIYDAVADQDALRSWLAYEGLDWHLIATSTSRSWDRSWRVVDLQPLAADAERALIASIVGDHAADRLAPGLAERAGGITIELCTLAKAAYDEVRRGRTVNDVESSLTRATTSSFEAAWTLLSSSGQLTLRMASCFVTDRVPMALVVDCLQRVGWTRRVADDAINDVRDRMLAAGDASQLQLHQLVARFARDRSSLPDPIRRALFEGLIAAATAFSENPGSLDHRALMSAHSLDLEAWADLLTDGIQLRIVGIAITELGRFADALPWFERAVAAAENGDGHGRVDSESLGASLHQVGYCHSRLGRFADALPWFERAVAAGEKGGVHGRVSSESLGGSLHQVGFCHSRMGRFAEALPWFERAVAASAQGDVHGRVDPASLGRSFHQVGDCHSRMGRFSDALPWFERAVAAKQQGDVHGRVDSASLGMSLHQVGYCLSRMGKLADALPWFERAVAAAEKGDAHGRVRKA